MTQIHFELTTHANGEYGWRIKHVNGNILADSGEGYKNQSDCMAALVKLIAYVKESPFGELLAQCQVNETA